MKCTCNDKPLVVLTLELIIQDKPCTAVTHIFDSSPPRGQAEKE